MLTYGPLINGDVLFEDRQHDDLLSPYDKGLVATVHLASQDDMLTVVEGLSQAFETTRHWSVYQRASCLKRIAHGLRRDKLVFAETITKESAKPITAALAEVERAIYTFETAAEETKQIIGEVIPLDTLPQHDYREAKFIYMPKGPVAGITPFNFPLNLVAHKVAPAIASGNPIVIKPAPQTPITAIKLGQLLIESGWPKEAIAVTPCKNDIAEILVSDMRIKTLTFTGSDLVGWQLKKIANKKTVTLELGGNAANIVHSDAAQSYALSRIVWGAFVNSGQTCVSAQRTFIHESIYQSFKSKLIAEIKAIPYGDPFEKDTLVGPLISDTATDNVIHRINDALASGANCLVGGKKEGNIIQPTLIESDDETLSISKEEVFGPVLVISPYKDIQEVVEKVNRSRYGLQAGLFTNDMNIIHYASTHLEVGGLNINDVSTFRIDHMPYGGVKDSGFGHEGLKYAIREMMVKKLITYNYLDE